MGYRPKSWRRWLVSCLVPRHAGTPRWHVCPRHANRHSNYSAFPLPHSSIQVLHSVHSLPSIPQRSLLGTWAPSIETACQPVHSISSWWRYSPPLSERGTAGVLRPRPRSKDKMSTWANGWATVPSFVAVGRMLYLSVRVAAWMWSSGEKNLCSDYSSGAELGSVDSSGEQIETLAWIKCLCVCVCASALRFTKPASFQMWLFYQNNFVVLFSRSWHVWFCFTGFVTYIDGIFYIVFTVTMS